MSTVTLYIAASLDGFIADEDGSVSWLESFGTNTDTYDDGESGGSYKEFFETVDCLVMGANTYEQIITEFIDDMPEKWPYGETPTYVITHRELPKKTESITFHGGDLRALIDTVQEYDHVWLVGGAALAQEFLKRDLIDEMRLSMIPTLLGGGISLFGDSDTEKTLQLMDTTAYESGIVELRYAVRTT